MCDLRRFSHLSVKNFLDIVLKSVCFFAYFDQEIFILISIKKKSLKLCVSIVSIINSKLSNLICVLGNVSGSSENQTKTNQLNTEISAGEL